MNLRCSVKLAPCRAWPDCRLPPVGIYMNLPHVREINDKTVVHESKSGYIVAATAQRYIKLLLHCKVQAGAHVILGPRPRDHPRVLINEAVEYGPGLIVLRT